MLTDREYLHLEEISEIQGLSKFDLIELIREEKISTYAFIPEQKLTGVTRIKNEPKNSTTGNFYYEGIIKFLHKDAFNLIQQQKNIKVTYVLIMELEKIKNWDSSSPSVIFPNNEFLNHLNLNHPPKQQFYACSKITPDKEHLRPLFELINGAAIAWTGNYDALSDSKDKIDDQLHEMQDTVSILSIEIEYHSFRFRKSEVLSLLRSKQAKQIEKPNKTASSPLDEVIIQVAKNNPGRSDHIWNTLRKESKKEIFDRQYDEDGILEEISQTQIIWRNDRTSQEKTLSRAGFKNKLSNLKKVHGLNWP